MSRAETYRNAAQQALDWAAARVGEDGIIRGSEGELFGYYKSLMAFGSGGRNSEVGRIVRCLRRDFFADGAFERGSHPGATVGPIYRDSWLTWGAHNAAAYDMALPAINRLAANLEPETCGARVAEDAPTVDWGLTCAAATALLAGGRVDEAIAAARLLPRILDAQSDPSRLIMRWVPGQGLADAGSTKPYAWLLERGARGQAYWYLGFGMVVAARFFRATGDRNWLALGERIWTFVDGCRADFEDNTTTSKIAWGAALLFDVTGEEKYERLATEIADRLVATQLPEGIWIRKPHESSAATQPIPVTLDATLERAFYLSEICRALA